MIEIILFFTLQSHVVCISMWSIVCDIFIFGIFVSFITWNLLYCGQLLDEKKLQKIDNLYKDFETPDAASKV